MNRDQLTGIFPPVPTPFDAAGAVATGELARNLAHWARYPLSGYVVLGSNGEAVLLNDDETLAVLAAAREAIPTDRLMIVGTGRQATGETLAWTRRAAGAGADAALVLPPSYYRGQMTRDVLVRHFHAVADASPIPLLVYNMPACTGLDLDAGTVLEIADHDNVVGIKDSGGDVGKLSEIRRDGPPDFAILAGSAGFLLSALEAGADGGVLGLANIAPAPCLEIVAAHDRGEIDAAREIQERLVRPNTAVTREWGVAAMKAALDMIGLYGGPPRAPLQPLDAARLADLGNILTAAGILPADQGETKP